MYFSRAAYSPNVAQYRLCTHGSSTRFTSGSYNSKLHGRLELCDSMLGLSSHAYPYMLLVPLSDVANGGGLLVAPSTDTDNFSI